MCSYFSGILILGGISACVSELFHDYPNMYDYEL